MIILIFAINFIFNSNFGFAQNNCENITYLQDLNKKYIKIKDLLSYDDQSILNRNTIYGTNDSIITISWKNKLWFFYRSINEEEDKLELFNFYQNKIKKVTDIGLSSLGAATETDIKIFSNKMFIIQSFSETENVSDFVLVLIDDLNDQIDHQILVREKSLPNKMLICGDSLIIEVQSYIARLNWMYFLEFWMPRGRSQKYELIRDGNIIRYIYDRNFNLTLKEESNSEPYIFEQF